MENLPKEVFNVILQQLCINDLVRVSRVSRKWLLQSNLDNQIHLLN
jgi:hypothetical protein